MKVGLKVSYFRPQEPAANRERFVAYKSPIVSLAISFYMESRLPNVRRGFRKVLRS